MCSAGRKANHNRQEDQAGVELLGTQGWLADAEVAAAGRLSESTGLSRVV